MKHLLKKVARWAIEKTPYEVTKRGVSPATLSAALLAFSLYARDRREPVLVQVGACDGTTGDPIHDLVRSGAFKAILVEPLRPAFERLALNYRGVSGVLLVNAAIHTEDGCLTMYKPRETGRFAGHYGAWQWTSFSRQHVMRLGVKPNEIEEVRVEALSLRTLTERFALPRIDLLQIDAEGYDADVVEMALRLPALPACICFEYVHVKSSRLRDLFAQLRAAGYSWIHDSMNTVAVRETAVQEILGLSAPRTA